MRVKMLKDAMGSENGYLNNSYTNGHVYDIEDSLAKVFVDNGSAQEVGGEVEVTDKVPTGPDAVAAQRPDLYPNRMVVRKPAPKVEDEKKPKEKASKKVDSSKDVSEDEGATSKKKKAEDVENKALKGSDYENKSAT